MRIDLNLASVLEAIMLERNVTRAASTLAMSQPAVSNALRRARSLLKDELFLKEAHGVRPTSTMSALWPELHRSLAALRSSMAPSQFDPRTDPTLFRLAITDSLSEAVVCEVAARINDEAPNARVVFMHHTNARSLEGIERGTVDCAVGMFPSLPHGMHVHGLAADHYVCVLRKGHPLAAAMTLDGFACARHVLASPSGREMGIVDSWLSLQDRTRTIAVVVNHFRDALELVSRSDLLACAPRSYLDGPGRAAMDQNGLTAVPLPFETERLLFKAVWHERVNAHAAQQWVRGIVLDTVEAALRG